MFEVQILIPQWDNDGVAFTQTFWDSLESELRNQFGGWTRAAGVIGSWVNDASKVFKDSSRVYIVACRGLADAQRVVDVARLAKRWFKQEAIYVRYLGLSETV